MTIFTDFLFTNQSNMSPSSGILFDYILNRPLFMKNWAFLYRLTSITQYGNKWQNNLNKYILFIFNL